MQVAYSGTSGRVPRYACVRAHHLHGTDHSCQSVGGTRLEKAIATAFLEAVTPAGIRASAQAIEELEHQHDERLAGQRLALERAEFEAGRAQRQFDACEPEHRLVARTLEARLEQTLAELERERRKLAELERRRPEPLTPAERDALARVARDLPRLWDAPTTTPRDRKELLRTLIGEITITVNEQPRRAEIEILWEGGARTELQVPLIRRGTKRTCTPEDTVELIRRLAEHHPDRQIAAISTSRAAAPAPDCSSPNPASSTSASRTPSQPHRLRTPTAASSPSIRPRPNSASPPPRSTAGSGPDCCRASRPPHTRPGGSGSATRSARASCPTSPTATCHSIRRPRPSAALARPSCTRSNAASSPPFRSPAVAAKGSGFRYPAARLD
jgi:hypothetical protein